MGTLTIECDTGKASDGYHTFEELYDHRCHLFVALMRSNPTLAWRANNHENGTMFDGWFVAGMHLPINDNAPVTHKIISKHNLKNRETGTLLGTYRLSIADADLAEASWHRTGAGYIHRQKHLPFPKGYLHRIVAERIFGVIPDGYEVDHINRNVSDDSRMNLRLVTSRGNSMNIGRIGCAYQRKNGKWTAKYGSSPVINLGTFVSKEEALAKCCEYHNELLEKAETEGNFIVYRPQGTGVSYHLPVVMWEMLDGCLIATSNKAPQWDGHTATDTVKRLAAWCVPNAVMSGHEKT